LLAATDAADRLATVEERNRLVVLSLAILDNEGIPRVVRIHGEMPTTSVTPGITEQPGEAVLSARAFAKHLVT
jgi:hypothetical protein